MSANIEAGKEWVVSQQIGEPGKSGILQSGPLPGPVHINGHPENLSLKLYKSGGLVEISSGITHSVVKGYLPDEVMIKGQVLYHALSQKYGASTFVLIGLGAAIKFGEGHDDYLKVENLIDVSGVAISKQNKKDNLQLSHTAGEIVTGEIVNLLPDELISAHAEQVSIQLDKYPDLTKPRTAVELERDMREARAILCLEPHSQDLLAFGKIEYYGVNEARQVLYEFGSWVCFAGNGYGLQVLEAAKDLAAEQFPFARLIAIVRSSNLKAQNIITQSGGIKVGYIPPEMKHVYDITRRRQPLEIVKMGIGGIWTRERNNKHII